MKITEKNMGIMILLFLLCAKVVSQEQDLQSVLQFESVSTDLRLDGWGGGPWETIHFDSTMIFSGNGAVRLERDEGSPQQFTTITRRIPIDFEGQRIELSGHLRTESVNGFCGLWMREDGPYGALQFDNMAGRGPTGNTGWTRYTINLPLDINAEQLYFGVLISGEGKVWADDLQLLVDGKTIDQAPKRTVESTILDTD